MASYRKLKVHEVGTDTYVDYEANVSERRNHFRFRIENNCLFIFYSSINVCRVHVLFTLVSLYDVC